MPWWHLGCSLRKGLWRRWLAVSLLLYVNRLRMTALDHIWWGFWGGLLHCKRKNDQFRRLCRFALVCVVSRRGLFFLILAFFARLARRGRVAHRVIFMLVIVRLDWAELATQEWLIGLHSMRLRRPLIIRVIILAVSLRRWVLRWVIKRSLRLVESRNIFLVSLLLILFYCKSHFLIDATMTR